MSNHTVTLNTDSNMTKKQVTNNNREVPLIHLHGYPSQDTFLWLKNQKTLRNTIKGEILQSKFPQLAKVMLLDVDRQCASSE